MSKKLEQKQLRREAEERRKAEEKRARFRRNAITIGIAVAVIAGVVVLIANERSNEQSVATGPLGVSAADASCGEIEEKEITARDHVPDGQQVDYPDSPPMGGAHWATPADATFYSAPLDEEPVVHTLEHGQIVIWYDPDAPDEMIDLIEDYVDRENDAALERGEGVGPLLAVPYPDLDASNPVAITAWGAKQECAKFSSEVVDDFRERYQGRGPEQIASVYTKGE